MRKSTLRKLCFLMALLSPIAVGNLWAQLQNGKVYYFENKAFAGNSLTSTSGTNLSIASTSTSDYKQLWYAMETSSGVYALLNLENGKFLNSSNSSNSAWSTVTSLGESTQFQVENVETGYYALKALNATANDHYMHCGSNGGTVVCWSAGAGGSRWSINEAYVSSSELQNRLNASDGYKAVAAEVALKNLFTDNACTEFKNTYYSLSALQADANYLALPTALQQMAEKIYNNNWTEDNADYSKSDWGSDYAKKYRVQLYEPYCDKDKAATALGINPHSYMGNNPTGIFANNGETIYVMVEGKIDSDATLYLASFTGNPRPSNTGRNSGTQLKEGLNVINYTGDGNNLVINYVVNTFDTSNGKKGMNAIYRKLSEFPTLKIHIEGGHINGYYNKVGDDLYEADNSSDWEYIEQRATQTTVPVVGKYMTLLFPVHDILDSEKGSVLYKGLESYFNELVSIEACINEWDNVMVWERLLMGLMDQATINEKSVKSPYSTHNNVIAYTGNEGDFGSDYSEYYNIHGLGWASDGDLYMYGTTDHSAYHFNTMDGVIKELPTSSGAHWGPGHEIGHQHQGPLNMNGLTEVTNNLFANVVLWFFGETTARYNGTDGALYKVLEQFNTEGADFFSNNIWAQTIMYYKLFLYYHVLGNNPTFYPRLFEMLRQEPMSAGYSQDGSTCLMHFYKKCCDAAGEDLTEFFRAHGFFEVMNDRFVGDYSNSVYNLTQDQIDAAIQDVKDKNYPVNLSVLFINDATGENTISHKTGNALGLYDGSPCAEKGGYATFKEAAAPSYSYSVNGNSVSMSGQGGVGYVVLNEKGEIIGFSDKSTFNLSNEAMEQLINGEATIAAVNKTGETVEAASDLNRDEMARTLLSELIEQGDQIMSLSDDSGKKMGYYKSTYTEDVNEALTQAKTVYNNNETAAYASVYNNLKEAIDELKDKQFTKNRMTAGTFILRNYACNGHMQAYYDDYTSSYELIVSTQTNENALGDAEKWVFEAADGENNFYIKNLQSNLYVETAESNRVVSATAATKDKAAAFHVNDIGNGIFRLVCQLGEQKDLHGTSLGGYVVGYGDSDGSRWYITALEIDEATAEQQALEELIAQTEEYLEEVAEINKDGDAIDLTEDNYYTNAKCKNTLYGDQFTSYSVLCDKNAETFLHTDYSNQNSDDGLAHYIRVDLGEDNPVSLFTFTYQNRNGGNGKQHPTAIRVEGSNEENGDYDVIEELTSAVDNLPTGLGQTYISEILGSKEKSYRYLRFVVTATTSNMADGNGHIYFLMGELGVSKVDVEIAPLAKYASATNVAELTQAFDAIRQAKKDYKAGTDYEAAYNALLPYKNKLKTISENPASNELTAKQAELQALIDLTTGLINSCGTVEAQDATLDGTLTLQTQNPSGAFYLSTNADQNSLGSKTDGGGLAHLVDGITNSSENYFHSQWDSKDEGSKVNAFHYLQVDLGDDIELNKFKFNYVTRNNSNGSPYPTQIVVYASTDGTNFNTTLANLSTGLPLGGGQSYESGEITCGSQYKSLRFTVEKSAEGNGAHPLFDNVYCFAMSEFGLTAIGGSASYTVTVKDNVLATTGVTEEILLSAWQENQSAISAKNYAGSEEQLDKAIEKLQAEYDILYNAYNNIGEGGDDSGDGDDSGEAIDKSELATLIAATQQALDKCYDGDNLVYSNSLYLTEEFLAATESAISNAQSVYDNNSTNAEQLATAIANLEKVKSDLDYNLRHASLPVMVTTDMANPSLYRIRIKRSETSVLELTDDNYVAVSGSSKAGSKNQFWIFMDNSDQDGQVLILPYSKIAVESTKVNTSTGRFTASNSNGNWHRTWESDVFPGLTFSTGSNNMQSEDNNLSIAPGSGGCTWTLSAPKGYLIQNYGFKMRRSNDHQNDVTLTINGTTYTGTANLQQIDVTVNAAQATFQEGGANNKLTLEDFYVNIVPEGDLSVLASNDINDGSQKVSATAKDSNGYAQDWTIAPSQGTGCEGWFYISTTLGDKSNYFSNYGGVDLNIGFWNFGNDKADGGSNFQFTAVEDDELDKQSYYLLNNYFNNDTKVKGGHITGGTNPGYYPEVQAAAYNEAYSEAETLLKSEEEIQDDEYIAAYVKLKVANEDKDFEIQMPKVGTFYIIRSACSDSRGDQVMYATPENAIHFSEKHDGSNPEALWTLTEEGYLCNFQNGISVSTVTTWGGAHKLGENPQVVKINSISLDGQITFTPGNGHPLHAQTSNSLIVGWPNENNGSAWRMEEANVNVVEFPVSVTKYGYAGLHLNYPVNIPDGLEAYVVNKATGAEGVATLDKIEDGIIPANTGVIIKSQEAYDAGTTIDYILEHAASEGTKPEVSLLGGANYLKYVKAEPETDYYLFGAKSGVVGLYKAYEEYNIGGTTGFTEITEPGGTLNGVYPIPGNTYYICNKQTSGNDVVFSVANGAFAFNTEKKIDDSYRWLCSEAINVSAGTIQSAETMAASSQAMEIIIRNISGTNRWYFCGDKNVEKLSSESVFIWEPAGDGNFYLKKKYPTAAQGEGYLQTSSPSNMGAKATAQKFTAEYKYPTDAPEASADATNLVRFVCVGENVGKWINCQTTGGTPVYNSGQGGFTMHNVYTAGTATYYVFQNVATNQYFGWQGLTDNAYNWSLYDTVQTNGGGNGLQAGCVSMKNGKFLVVKNGNGWDQADGDGFYNATYSSSFYFEKYEAKSTSKTNDGGYFKCSANKIYLPYSAAANAAKFGFSFGGGVTTDIEEALFGNGEGQQIFDLQGRRVERITAPGLYIVNGQKRYVKAAKF